MDYVLAGYGSSELLEMLNDLVKIGIDNLSDNQRDAVQEIRAVLFRRGVRI